MPLCSAAYWCFCHIVKIYGAISLSRNGLIGMSGAGDLWANMADGVKGREPEQEASCTWIFVLTDGVPKQAGEITPAVCVKLLPDVR